MRSSLAAVLVFCCSTTFAQPTTAPATRPSPLGRPDVFPIAVWLQAPANAARYKAIGINLYVGLWDGPTEKQLATLAAAGMPVICAQNAEALNPRWDRQVVGFLQEDEPDNAQSLPGGKGYGPPITPDKILERYHAMKSADVHGRPVMLNLGQGVAWDGYYGRGVRSRHPEDYPLYAQGGDIVSFDIYPAVHEDKPVAGKLEFVGRGVQRLVQWTESRKPVWACIECTHISNPAKRATSAQVRAEVWMAIAHGARGITYFAHQFKPRFIEAGLLADAEMAEAVKGINAEVQTLAPAILSATPADLHATEVTATTADGAAAPAEAIATLSARGKDGVTWVVAVSQTPQPLSVHFRLAGAGGEATVLNEQRVVPVADNAWSDGFAGYAVHVYAIGKPR
jgi:hypothetical protein